MKRYAILATMIAGFAVPASAATTAYVLDFTDATCSNSLGNPTPCGIATGVGIDQSHGDVPGVLDVLYNNSFTDTDREGTFAGRLSFWPDAAGVGGTPGFSEFADLSNVAYSFLENVAASIFLKPLDGSTVTLNSFDLGGFGGDFPRSSQVRIEDGLGNELSSTGAINVSSIVADSFLNPGQWSSIHGIRIIFGPTANSVAIDNISFSLTTADAPVGQVPLPASAFLLLGGLAALGALRGKRRAV